MSRLRLILLWVAVAGAHSAWAQELPSTARLLDGKTFAATLQRIESDKVVLSENERERAIPLDDLLVWGSPAEIRKGSYLLLADGGVIAADVKTFANGQVNFESVRRPGLWQLNNLPRASVRAIVYQASASPTERERFDWQLLSSFEAQDRLLLTSGDSLKGTLLGISLPSDAAEGATPSLRFLPQGLKYPLVIAQEKAVALVLGGGRSEKASDAGSFWLGMADGSLVSAKGIELRDDAMMISLATGGMLTARVSDDDTEPTESFWSRVTVIQPLSQRVSYLSDLKTIGFKHVPLLDWQQDFATDRSITHSRLRAHGERFVRGIGMPATSRLAYEIPIGAKRFEAEIAIDDDAGREGSVIFRVFLEAAGGSWKPAFESKVVRGGDPIQNVRVDLGDAQRLALVVDMADRGDERDWADWLNARFVK
jgi:hypothetical protein